MDFLNALDPDQLAVVTHSDSPLKVVAGAGAGKTRTLVSRVAYQIATGVADPKFMFVSAFTRDAANEMKDRLEDIVDAEGLYVGTFHGILFRFLNDLRFQDSKPALAICTEGRKTALLRDLLAQPSKDFPEAIGSENDVAVVSKRIGLWKNNLIRHSDPEIAQTLTDNEARSDLWAAAAVYPLYERRLASMGMADFDDMLLLSYETLKSDSRALRVAHSRWNAFFLDEVQDFNVAQWEIMKLLAPPRDEPNITIVGDPRQALYRFRSATPELMDDFQKTWKGSSQIDLTKNYRCSASIVDHANALVSQFSVKPQVAERSGGKEPTYVGFSSCIEQAHEIARYVMDYKEEGSGGDIAVLVRTNAQTADIESAFVANRIPYWCQSGGFFDRMEIGDLMAYLRLACDHRNVEALGRIINKPTRYLGARYVDAVAAKAGSGSLLTAMRQVTRYTTKSMFQKQLSAAQELADLVEYIDPGMSAHSAIDLILKDTDYLDWVKKTSGGAPGVDDSREENVNVLLSIADQQGSVASLVSFASEASLLQTKDDDSVEICTVHRAKGREWPVVFVANMHEGSIPHVSAIRDGGMFAVADELRIAYVGYTRAKDRLFVCVPATDSFGNVASPSRFMVSNGHWPEKANLSEAWWDFI